MLQRFLSLRLEREMFMNEKVTVMAEVSGQMWLWDLAM
jgi:hypothetical protein